MDYDASVTLRVAMIAAAVTAVGVAYSLRPETPPNPLTEALQLCGDTPAPVKYERLSEARYAPSLPMEPDPQPYALAVKSVDDCRAKVLDHFQSPK